RRPEVLTHELLYLLIAGYLEPLITDAITRQEALCGPTCRTPMRTENVYTPTAAVRMCGTPDGRQHCQCQYQHLHGFLRRGPRGLGLLLPPHQTLRMS